MVLNVRNLNQINVQGGLRTLCLNCTQEIFQIKDNQIWNQMKINKQKKDASTNLSHQLLSLNDTNHLFNLLN